jgi:hypothetical protein
MSAFCEECGDILTQEESDFYGGFCCSCYHMLKDMIEQERDEDAERSPE